jgi:hypothetical protein
LSENFATIPSDFLYKNKWINIIIDLGSFLEDNEKKFKLKKIELSQQCRVSKIYLSSSQYND